MTSEALIIFVRHPELGKVKTRLAREVGDITALAIYKTLLEHTRIIAEAVEAERFIFYEDRVHNGDVWPETGFRKMAQQGETLGDRMFNAFSVVFGLGYTRVVIIGSDCLELTTENIRAAFDRILSEEVVLGPARDGGYYLMGMRRLIGDAFLEKKWSSETVLQNTLSDLARIKVSVSLLPELSDIDTYSDLPAAVKQAFNI